MKHILILTTKKTGNKERFVELLHKDLAETANVTLGLFDDLVFEVEKGTVEVFLGDKNIKDFDLVYFRKVGKISIGSTLANCLRHLNIKFFDTTLEETGYFGNKLTSLVKLAWADLPVIPTFYCSKENVKVYKDRIIKKLGFPIVIKDLNLQRGEGIFILKNEADFDKLSHEDPTKHYLFQKFLESNEEYRILVLGNTIGVYETKTRTDPNEFRSNVALGATEEFLNPNDIPTSLKEIAVKASNILKVQIAGVDIMVEKGTNKHWLLEVNRGPGLTYDDPNSNEVSSIANFLKEELH